jgi:hypothetical protein
MSHSHLQADANGPALPDAHSSDCPPGACGYSGHGMITDHGYPVALRAVGNQLMVPPR